MTFRAPAPPAFLRRLVIVAATAAMAAVGWFLLDEPDPVGALETAPAPAGEVLARVAGQQLTHDDVRHAARHELDELEREVGERRRRILERGLESGIADLLLDAEARRRGIGREALLEAEVESKLGLVADDAVEEARRAHPEADDEEIRRHLRQAAFLDELRSRHGVEVYGERMARIDGE